MVTLRTVSYPSILTSTCFHLSLLITDRSDSLRTVHSQQPVYPNENDNFMAEMKVGKLNSALYGQHHTLTAIPDVLAKEKFDHSKSMNKNIDKQMNR